MPDYSPLRDFIGAVLACLPVLALFAAVWVATPN